MKLSKTMYTVLYRDFQGRLQARQFDSIKAAAEIFRMVTMDYKNGRVLHPN